MPIGHVGPAAAAAAAYLSPNISSQSEGMILAYNISSFKGTVEREKFVMELVLLFLNCIFSSYEQP